METFEMVAKTMAGLEQVLAEELRGLGAECVEPGRRMVSFKGDKAMLYKANLCCRTALRVLKPFYKFTASTPDELYEQCKEYDWGSILKSTSTFCIDTVAFSDDFTHSHYVTYRVKDAIVDWFRDRYGEGTRPRVRLEDADVMINVHISANNVTLSLDSSGESLHKRGYRVAQTEAPINEVLAAGIILLSGWRGECPFVDPMCGSGTFLIEAALIAANINPGIYRKSFAFENWPDFDKELFDSIYNDDSQERKPQFRISGADISEDALDIAMRNIMSAGVGQYIDIKRKAIAQWEEAPQPAGVMITNPPYGERIKAPDMEALYKTIGNRLKNVFVGYHAWIIGYRDEYFRMIGLAPSTKLKLYNGSLECELKEYIIFEGDKKSFLAAGGKLKEGDEEGAPEETEAPEERKDRPRRDFRRDGEDRPRRDFRDRRDGEDRPRRDFRRDGEERPRRDFHRDGEERPRRDFRRDGEDRPRRDFRRDGEERPRRDFRRDGEDRPRRDFRKDGEDRPRRDFRRDGEDRPRRDFRDRKDGDFRREGRDFRDRRDGDFRGKGRDYRDFDKKAEAENSENPLAIRRNPNALRMLQNKQPSLPPAEGPVMRKRGWRKKGDQDTEQSEG